MKLKKKSRSGDQNLKGKQSHLYCHTHSCVCGNAQRYLKTSTLFSVQHYCLVAENEKRFHPALNLPA